MRQVPEHVPFETKAVLLGGTGPLRPCISSCWREAGDWKQAKSFATHLRLKESEVGEIWWQAMRWAAAGFGACLAHAARFTPLD